MWVFRPFFHVCRPHETAATNKQTKNKWKWKWRKQCRRLDISKTPRRHQTALSLARTWKPLIYGQRQTHHFGQNCQNNCRCRWGDGKTAKAKGAKISIHWWPSFTATLNAWRRNERKLSSYRRRRRLLFLLLLLHHRRRQNDGQQRAVNNRWIDDTARPHGRCRFVLVGGRSLGRSYGRSGSWCIEQKRLYKETRRNEIIDDDDCIDEQRQMQRQWQWQWQWQW